jgi:hypothetical protein
MNAKDWLGQVANELEAKSPLRNPRKHLGTFVSSLSKESSLPKRFITPQTALDTAAEIHLAGALPNYPEMVAIIRSVGQRYEQANPVVVKEGQAEKAPDEDEHIRLGERWLARALDEGKSGAALANVVDLIRIHYPAAYRRIAPIHDKERWENDKRVARESLERQDYLAQQARQAERVAQRAVQAPGAQRYQTSRPAPPEPARKLAVKPLEGAALAAFRRGAQAGVIISDGGGGRS